MKKYLLLLVICVMALIFAGFTNNPNSNYEAKAFSVSSSKQVHFSPGNLQYTQSTDTWSFASAQYEVIGTDNVRGSMKQSGVGSAYSGDGSAYSVYSDVTSDNPVFSTEYGGVCKSGTALADKVDLFGWSTNATNFGVSTSKNYEDYSGSYVDWGANKIGNDAPNTWRALTYDEWNYLRNGRPNASSLYGVAQVNGVNGLILLPDSWSCPAGVTFKSGFPSDLGAGYYAAYQTFTAEQWSKLEESGAIFLPAAGWRLGSDVRDVQDHGFYWSATARSSSRACYYSFFSTEDKMKIYVFYHGYSVRLVKDL